MKDPEFDWMSEGGPLEDEFSENDGFWRDLEEGSGRDTWPDPLELSEMMADVRSALSGNPQFAAIGRDRAHTELFEAGYRWRTNCKDSEPDLALAKERLRGEFAICQTAYDCLGNIIPGYVSIWTRGTVV